MEVPKQRARCGPQHCVLGLTDTDTYVQGGNYQHSLQAAVAYESYRTRRRKEGNGFTLTEWPTNVGDSSYFSEEAWCASCHSSSNCDLWWGACCAHPERRCEARARSRRRARKYLQSRMKGKISDTAVNKRFEPIIFSETLVRVGLDLATTKSKLQTFTS